MWSHLRKRVKGLAHALSQRPENGHLGLALVAVSVHLQRDKSGTTGALPRLRQSRHDPQPVRRLTLNSYHRLFIQRPRRIISMPGPALTGRHA